MNAAAAINAPCEHGPWPARECTARHTPRRVDLGYIAIRACGLLTLTWTSFLIWLAWRAIHAL